MTKESEVSEDMRKAQIEPQYRRKEVPPCSCGWSSLIDMSLHHHDCDARLIYEYNCMVTHIYYAEGWQVAWHARDAVIAQFHEDARRVADAVNLELNDLRSKWYTAERKLAKRDSEIAKFKSERGIHNIPHQMAGESWGEFLQRAETWLSFETAVARRAAIEECAALADSFSGVAMLAQEIRKLASPENQFTCTACHKTFASTPEDAEIGHLCIAADRGMTQREAIEEIKRSPPLASPEKETP